MAKGCNLRKNESYSGISKLAANVVRTLATFQVYFRPVGQAIRHPSSLYSSSGGNPGYLTPSRILYQVRNISREQLVTLGVVSAEVFGFYKVGEIIGRRKLVGYRGDTAEHH